MKQSATFPYHLYTISGMGLNENLFSALDLPFESVNHIKWIEPNTSSESLVDYCKRLCEQIHHEERIVLLGCSFGGMVAKEISELIEVEKVIIVSSIKNAKEKPIAFDMLGLVPVHLMTPGVIKKMTFPIWAPMFGLENQDEKSFFSKMFLTTSESYKDWATTQIARWKNNLPSKNTLHIHGDNDLIFPLFSIRGAEVIEGGDHAMIVKRANEVDTIIYNYMERFHHQKEKEVV